LMKLRTETGERWTAEMCAATQIGERCRQAGRHGLAPVMAARNGVAEQ
jgi:hypothetical protein